MCVEKPLKSLSSKHKQFGLAVLFLIVLRETRCACKPACPFLTNQLAVAEGKKDWEWERGDRKGVCGSQVKERHVEIQTEKVERKEEIFSTAGERNFGRIERGSQEQERGGGEAFCECSCWTKAPGLIGALPDTFMNTPAAKIVCIYNSTLTCVNSINDKSITKWRSETFLSFTMTWLRGNHILPRLTSLGKGRRGVRSSSVYYIQPYCHRAASI